MASSGTVVQPIPFPQAASRTLGEGLPAPFSQTAQAEALTAELRRIDETFRNGFIRCGLICVEVRDHRLWVELGFESFNDWLTDTAPYSRSHCYSAMKTLEELKDIPVANLLEMNPRNLSTVKKLSTDVRNDPEVLRAASTMPQDAFAGYLAANHSSQHLESRTAGRKLSPSLWRLLDDAVAEAQRRYGFVDWEDSLESILADYLASVPLPDQPVV